MKISIAFVCVLFTAGSVLAQNYYRAEQQARRASAQKDAEQQRIQKAASEPAGAPSARAAAAAAAAPVDPALQATLNNVAGLQSDFAALSNVAGDKPDPSQKISLLNNLSQAAQGTKASSASVKKLADDLLTAVAGKKQIAAAQQTRLARGGHPPFNSSHLTAAQQQTLLADAQKILTEGGASLDDAVDVVTDLKTVADETK